MGTRSRSWALAWALVALLMVWPAETKSQVKPVDFSHRTNGALDLAHNRRVCSTWGDFHYKTFDGDIFRFPGLCNYVFSEPCRATYEDFNVQLRRSLVDSRPTISHIILKVQGIVLELSNSSVLVNGQWEKLPYSRAGVLVEQTSAYMKVSVRLLLTFLWNGRDSALLELDPKYANQTCGLCGDFNGLKGHNEFFAHGTRLTPLQFGNLQKMDGPTEQCKDPLPSVAGNCTDKEDICRCTLLGSAFAKCNTLVDPDEYVTACVQDLCCCPTCLCDTFAEYSRQCAYAGGQPQNWRGPKFCPRTCPRNMQHQECGSPCMDTCSNPQRSQLCEDHCMEGCFCPPGTVLDDITHSGCLPLPKCPCTHGGHIYKPGSSFNTTCSSCTCTGSLWQCQDLPCPGTCSVQGGSHISTYDSKLYDVHGDCSYILSKKCVDSSFIVLVELRKCGQTDTENCLRTVTLELNGGDTTIAILDSGSVYVNSIYTQLPMLAANITIFRPTSFFILVHTRLGLQVKVQLVPLMLVYIRLDPSYHGQMCGLCGNFNQNQADDFMALSGVVEGTGAAFSNTWKTHASCPNSKNIFEEPCSLSVENENYAQHWCSLLTNTSGAFSACHSTINPSPFYKNCLFDTCNCEKSEDCLCAALSSYVQACAARGVLLRGWRDGVCTKYMNNCPKSQSYKYVVDTCLPTCRALNEADATCMVTFVPVDGCTCPDNTFLNDAGLCVLAQECPCYAHSRMVAPGQAMQDNGMMCTCAHGKMSCVGAVSHKLVGCKAPMKYLDCNNVTVRTHGTECFTTCHSLDMGCFSLQCVSGCVCPQGLVEDGRGGCMAKEDCPCVHNEASYKPGATIRIDCNTCTCKNRRWECSSRPCLGTCTAYGDGHFITFDQERYRFEGNCQYTLAQDYCEGNGSTNGTFRIITENVPCGTVGTTCSKAIRLFTEGYEMVFHDGIFKVVTKGHNGALPYQIRHMGIFLVVETHSGLVVSWDRKTSVLIRLHQHYKGKVCGLCGNYDGNALNDFTTRSRAVVGDVLEFGNSWKFSPSCPNALVPTDPCTTNPYRKSWAQKQCSILHSATFASCHSEVDSKKYYEACVHDSCACDSGGDCECFCTSVATYAQACREVGVCVSWRTPDICPLFCDYYNPHGECEWHYKPCGAPCMRTCRNPSGRCLFDLPGMEGCYAKCPPSKPIFNEDLMKCVAQCGCYDENGNYHDIGKQVPTSQNCQSCHCSPHGLRCWHNPTACTCTYEGQTYHYQDVIYNTTDGLGACLMAICGKNGTVIRRTKECLGIPTKPPFTFTSSSTVSESTLSTVCVREVCKWSSWYDSSRPEPGIEGGDFETFGNLRQKGYQVCQAPTAIQCRAEQFRSKPLQELGQMVDCDPAWGLTCLNSEQNPPLCYNYELRVLCCEHVPCGPISTTSSSSAIPGICRPRCQWTEWFDKDYPKTEEFGGDIETYDKIRAAGGHICKQPQAIQCEAENFPGQTLEQVGQQVSCDVHSGLICHNQNQMGMFPMCYNYRIRVLCCSTSHCVTATTPPAMLAPTASQGTTHCQPNCEWTEWFDTDFPTSGVEGGDMETYENIRAAGGKMCQEPKKIECRAESYPAVSIDQVGQVVNCSLQVGLVCRNKDQRGEFNMCFNYNVRVLCCDDYSHCPYWAVPRSSSAPPTAAALSRPSHQPLLGTATIHTVPGPLGPRPAWTTRATSPMITRPIMGAISHKIGHTTPELTTTSISSTPTRPITAPTPTQGTIYTPPVLTIMVTSPETTKRTVAHSTPETLHTSVLTTRATSPMATISTEFSFAPGSTHTPAISPSSLLTFSVSTTSPSSLSSLRPMTLSSPHSSPTPCICEAYGRLFSPGDVIYNKTDVAGCNFYAICTQNCSIDRFHGTCPTPSSAVSFSPVPLPSLLASGCDNAVPPPTACSLWQVNESWRMDNCTMARCKGNNQVVLLEPEPVANVTCVNQHLPIKVWNKSQPCLFHYECECFCSGWGDRNLMTFDGTAYSFQGNCTYILMKEIQPSHGNLSILIHKNYCRANVTTSCPRTLQVYYESTEIILTTTNDSGVEESLILFNQMPVSRGFSKDDITVSVTGASTMSVDIPVGVWITFDTQSFQIWLSYRNFSHNTEGQCGTCTNNQRDDCRWSDGTIVPNCKDMAKSWVVPESGREECHVPAISPTSTSPEPPSSMSTYTSCPPAPLCKLMLSQVFAECHGVIAPHPFFHTCASDSCKGGHSILCHYLEVYATSCRSRDVCVDWRNATSGLCNFTCPLTKVYKPCGPMQPASCDSKTRRPPSQRLAEGCFCPEDQLLFSLSSGICVPECGCVGPDGSPKSLGEQWVSNCQSCVCDKGLMSVRCKPVHCEAQDLPPQCGQPGFMALTRPQADNPCCPETLCVCNMTTCPHSPPKCGPGHELSSTQEKDGCCPRFTCRPKLCTYSGTAYGVGATFPGVAPCHTCTCLSVDAQDPTVQCKKVPCNTTCPQGFNYSNVTEQCVLAMCFTPEGQPIQPNETWVNSHVDNCTEYRCEANSWVTMLTPLPKPCPDVSNCSGTLRKTGCCYSCEERDLCQVRGNLTNLRYRDCETEAAVNVTFCEGSCPGGSKYSMEAQTLLHQCTCCQAKRAHQVAVAMWCANGTNIQHTYTQVDECSCSPTCLASTLAPMATHV